jgi:uncharacterized repeat protein (TIGR03803 family)
LLLPKQATQFPTLNFTRHASYHGPSPEGSKLRKNIHTIRNSTCGVESCRVADIARNPEARASGEEQRTSESFTDLTTTEIDTIGKSGDVMCLASSNYDRKTFWRGRLSSVAVLITLLVLPITLIHPLFAQTETTLYNFCALANCTDGEEPLAGLAMDDDCDLYGTTAHGGTFGGGTVLKVAPDGTETVLHSFGGTARDGSRPAAPVSIDAKGNLLGTTSLGGNHDGGTVFRISPSGRETILYSFCSVGGTSCRDGSGPESGLISDEEGNLYGTTTSGGAFNRGIAFRLSPSGRETVLHSFGSGMDGAQPSSPLVMDSKGNLYGTTQDGGDSNSCPDFGGSCGTIFKINSTGTETVLYNFCSAGTSHCRDGSEPVGIFLDRKGNLIGATYRGGDFNSGTVFLLTPTGSEMVIHSFNGNGVDGSYPLGGVTMDSAGSLYGTTSFGGSYFDYGVVYKIDHAGQESILHSFDFTDGYDSFASLLLDSEGNLYGTTSGGGVNSYTAGVVFKIVP